MPPEGYKQSYAEAYGGDFDQKDAGRGAEAICPFWSRTRWSSLAIRMPRSARASLAALALSAA
jgi:hypothetical protein